MTCHIFNKIHLESTSTGDWLGVQLKGSSGTNNYTAYFGILDSNGNFFIDNGSNGNDFVINPSGNVEIDSYSSPSTKTVSLRLGYTANQNGGVGMAAKAHAGSTADGLGLYGTDGVSMHTANAGTVYERLKIDTSGNVFAVGVYNATTGSGANQVVVSSGGKLRRVTSSQRYKTDIETLEDKYADAILEARPVYYKSLCEDDDKNHSHWGFIAEEIEKIDPRLCAYKTVEVVMEDGKSIEKKLDTPIVESVQYERFVPHLLNLIKRQDARIKDLEAKVVALGGS